MNKARRPQAPRVGSAEGPPGGSVVFLLSSLGFAASRAFQDALAPVGLTPRQFALMNLVATSEGISQGVLTQPLGIPASRLVGIVDELENKGLIERRRNPEDRRYYALHLTAKGRATLNRARRVARDNEERFCTPLEPSEREPLLESLRRLAAGQQLPLGVHPALASPDEDDHGPAPM
ncbi:MAG: winged helix-turn-helix transcriptional regulator [Acidimicrobiales bacterium]|nr:winged helix-turn-helix transcriptional regulator [Acidimicrobiales bacterium]